MLRYFIQPQLDMANNSIIGYELLIRQLTGNQWHLPKNLAAIPLAQQVDLFIASLAHLPKSQATVALNLNRTEFLNVDLVKAIIRAQDQFLNRPLIIELTEEPVALGAANELMTRQAELLAQHNIQLSLDDIGTGANTWPQLKPLLPWTSELKFAMQNFRHLNRTAEIPQLIQFWQSIAQQYHLRFILEGVETAADDQLATELGVNICQGYYYGKPHLLSLDSESAS